MFFFFFSSRRRHTRLTCDWSSDACSSDLPTQANGTNPLAFEAPAARKLTDSQLKSAIEQTTKAYSKDPSVQQAISPFDPRSEERRVGKECRSRWSPEQ